jgi:hypothetical protein
VLYLDDGTTHMKLLSRINSLTQLGEKYVVQTADYKLIDIRSGENINTGYFITGSINTSNGCPTVNVEFTDSRGQLREAKYDLLENKIMETEPENIELPGYVWPKPVNSQLPLYQSKDFRSFYLLKHLI